MGKQHIGMYVLIALMAWGACTQEKGWDITIQGKINFPDSSRQVYLQQVDGEGSVIGPKQEVAVSRDGTFKKVVEIEEPCYFRLNFYDLQQINFIVYRSDLEINVDGNAQSGFVELKGSPDADLIKRVSSIMEEIRKSPRAVELETVFEEARQNGDMEKVAEIQEAYMMDIIDDGQNKVAALLEEQGPSLAVISILNQGGLFNYDHNRDLYDHVVEELQASWPDYTLARAFIASVEKARKVAVGQPAPEIALSDTTGKVVKLSSFRGKYVLIDFWAKWCVPCRQENPNIVRAYKRYHDKGFEVFGVSLDDKRQDWLQAVNEDGLIWTNVSDLKAFNSPIVQDYQVNAIPTSVLVDPDGLIIAKDLRGKRLDDRLQALFDSPG